MRICLEISTSSLCSSDKKHPKYLVSCMRLNFSLCKYTGLQTDKHFSQKQRPIWSTGKVKQLYFRHTSVGDQKQIKNQ